MAIFFVKCLFKFGSTTGRGFSEVHYQQVTTSVLPSFDAIFNSMNILAPIRASLLSEELAINSFRASYPIPGAVAAQPRFVNFQGAPTVAGTAWSNSLAIDLRDASKGKHKILHLRGFPAVLVKDEEYDPVSAGAPGLAFQRKLAIYLNTLIASPDGTQWGWLTKATTSYFGVVTNYVQNADGTVTLSLLPDPTSGPPPTPGVFLPCRFSRINKSTSVLNRTWTCVFTAGVGGAPGTLTTVNAVAVGAFSGKGRFSVPVKTFVPYASFNSIELGERRMGRVSGLYPGRGKRRPTS